MRYWLVCTTNTLTIAFTIDVGHHIDYNINICELRRERQWKSLKIATCVVLSDPNYKLF